MTVHALHARGLEDLIDTRCVRCILRALGSTVEHRKALGLCEYCAGEMVAEVCLSCGTPKPRVL